ncbi:hypothetical protein [Trinickia dinghuensis]|uniref:hypothetical protein n=1 Tax=Trinickia dinghuensis TaxID=2291023 RepID=UPI0015F18622|nr:hypothetical protein [Trinickia dinghuensis]
MQNANMRRFCWASSRWVRCGVWPGEAPHAHSSTAGRIYLPGLNGILMIGAIAVVLDRA